MSSYQTPQFTSHAEHYFGAAYLDPTIDVRHTLIASQFTILFSICRLTSYDLPTSFLRTGGAIKIISQVWLLDIAFRTSLLAFNYSV